jgi:hypothetical protein
LILAILLSTLTKELTIIASTSGDGSDLFYFLNVSLMILYKMVQLLLLKYQYKYRRLFLLYYMYNLFLFY